MADKACIVSIRNLQIRFAENILFEDVNLDVCEDDFIVITTGIMDGATTLMKSLLGLVDTAQGKIIFEGSDILQAEDRVERRRSRQKIGLVYEAGGLISIMDVYHNLSLPLSYHTALSDDEIREKIMQVAEDLEITDLLYLEPNELNDTQTRIVNLARALVIEPRLLLIDELEGGMTVEMMTQIITVIRRYQQHHHFGIVLTTLDHKSNFATAHYTIKNKQLEVDYVR
jgi:ABC-type transporter Mla maintaining outer membrane lipid asymmetry ATPase subunit MlaF